MDEDTISQLKTEFEGKIEELIDDDVLEQMKKEKELIHSNNLILAKLAVKCHDVLYNNAEDKDLIDIEMVDLRNLVTDYYSGEMIGDYYTELHINRIVMQRREELVAIVTSFFKIIGDEM